MKSWVNFGHLPKTGGACALLVPLPCFQFLLFFFRQRSRRALKQKDDPNSRPESAGRLQSAGRPQSSDGKTPKSSVSSLRNEAKEAKYKKEVEDISTGTLCPVTDDVIAIHNRTHVKFVFLRTRKSRLLVPAENQG